MYFRGFREIPSQYVQLLMALFHPPPIIFTDIRYWKEVAFKKFRKNLFHTVIYLKIPFYIYQPFVLAAMNFFPFSSKILCAYLLNGSNTEKKKTASNVLLGSTNIANKVYNVQTMQTKFARFRQKSSGYYAGPPQRFRQIDAPGNYA